MEIVWLVATLLLWGIVAVHGFLLWGALRALALLRWRLEQLEATTPSRTSRSGLRLGKQAPDFTLPSITGPDVALHDFAGRKVLLVFMQVGCSPCRQIVPELNRLQRQGEAQVLVVNSGDAEAIRAWAAKVQAQFPVLRQEQLSLSKRYQVLATPFAFLIDAAGVIRSKGIINSAQHISYVLAGAYEGATENPVEAETEPQRADRGLSGDSLSSSYVKEVHHV
jgi:methylamine dehydrogenase accessory protein MauD